MAKKNLNIYWAELIVEELIRCGVDYFCISPGSRSTPLVVAIARNKKARSVICYDERGSAFHALGFARATNKAAAVITTSGTAAANLYPAVIEASNANVPMLVLTADRPQELIDTGANQTINQEHIFGKFTRWQFNFSCPTEQVLPEAVLTTIDQAVYRSSSNNPGPVHINCRYRKPLEPPSAGIKDSYIKNIKNWIDGTEPFTLYGKPIVTTDEETITSLANIINDTERAMVVVGELSSDVERKAVLKLIKKMNLTVYTDITSGLRLTDCPTHIMRYFDQELLSAAFNEFVRPSLVLHLGGRITSKRVNEFFAQNRPLQYILINNLHDRCDQIHAVTTRIESDLSWICELLSKKVTQKNAFLNIFSQKAQEVEQIITKNIDAEEEISEPFVARQISADIADHSGLFLSSSMPIRDMDLYGKTGRQSISVAANRGVSGIDGVIATAAGFAAGKKKSTTLLIGDLAFIHDINSLALVNNLQLPMIIILINNRGGGIFHFLPISKSEDVFERYFAAGHDYSFGGVCETFKIDYCKVTDKAGFINTYRSAIEKALPAVIEVSTDRESNLKLRRKMKKEILTVLEQEIR